MMKKTILILALLTWVNVSAETKYTDYEFQGYIEEKIEDDELNRYEATTFNKFYTMRESNVTYLGTLDKENFDYVDPNDNYTLNYTKEKRPDVYFKENYAIWLDKEYKIDKIFIKNADNFIDTMKEITFYTKDVEIHPEVTFDEQENIITYTLDREYDYSSIKMIIKYDLEGEYTFTYTTTRLDGEDPIPAKITLTGETDTSEIFAMPQDEFRAWIIKYYLNFYSVLRHYCYEITYYKHYNLEKDYYIDSEDTSIEGYEYDPSESYVLYKKYTREKIEVPDPEEEKPPIDEDPKEPSEDKLDDQNKVDNPIDTSVESGKDVIDKKPEPSENTKTPTTTQIVKHIYAYEPNPSKEENSESKEENDTTDQTNEVKCVCDCKYPDTEPVDSSNCEENKRSTLLLKIGTILLIIGTILMIIYEINVNRSAKND